MRKLVGGRCKSSGGEMMDVTGRGKRSLRAGTVVYSSLHQGPSMTPSCRRCLTNSYFNNKSLPVITDSSLGFPCPVFTSLPSLSPPWPSIGCRSIAFCMLYSPDPREANSPLIFILHILTRPTSSPSQPNCHLQRRCSPSSTEGPLDALCVFHNLTRIATTTLQGWYHDLHFMRRHSSLWVAQGHT